jgi:hypothetical protein
MKSYLEIFVVTPAREDAVQYIKKRLDITTVNSDPDDLVQEVITGTSGSSPLARQDRCLVHSTSWRYEGKEGIVLTYLVYSEEVYFQEEKTKWLCITGRKVLQSENPARPRPRNLQERDILFHGIRHLGFLMKDPKNDRMSRLMNGKTQVLFKRLQTELAGKIN